MRVTYLAHFAGLIVWCLDVNVDCKNLEYLNGRGRVLECLLRMNTRRPILFILWWGIGCRSLEVAVTPRDVPCSNFLFGQIFEHVSLICVAAGFYSLISPSITERFHTRGGKQVR